MQNVNNVAKKKAPPLPQKTGSMGYTKIRCPEKSSDIGLT
jgi:hypothetical protein